MEFYKKLLKEFVAFKSISADGAFRDDCYDTARWLSDLCRERGFDVELVEGYGNPIVLATFVVNPVFDTCLIYGHYDVQPASLSDGWDSDPFVLNERDGRLYARGVMDNKGQFLIHLVTLFDLIEKNRLGFNVVIMMEGNEETGSTGLGDFVSDYADVLKSDVAMFSDGETGECPTIDAGFRGGFNATLTLRTSHTDLHSGLYGSAVPSATFELCKLVSNFIDSENRVTIAGFYEDVDLMEDAVSETVREIPFDYEEFKRISGTKKIITEPGHNFYSQVGLRPAVQVTGISSGYTGEGYRNSIPAKAEAKINVRLVKNQNPDKIIKLFEEHIRNELPDYVDYAFDAHDPYEGVVLDFDSSYAKRAVKILEHISGHKPIFKYCGGGLPVVTYFYEILGIPTLSIGLANEDSGMHATNENFRIDYIERGLKFSEKFLSKH